MATASSTARLFTFLLLLFLSENVSADASTWLMKINSAAAEVNFVGTFVYTHNGEVETMEVARRIKDGMMQERLYSLNGAPREIIRGMDKVWHYIPDQNVVMYDYRQTSQSGFPKILPGDFEQLKRNYHFVEGSTGRIADRLVHQINVIPNDGYRYGYSLWADKTTGLLLRSDLINQQNEILEQYLFVDIEIGGDITDEQLIAVSNQNELQLYGNNTPTTASVDYSDWLLAQIPDGYTLSKHIRRMSPMDSGEVEHRVYTDGLSSVSVFIKEIREGQSEMSGLSRMGAVHAYRKTLNNHRITVMGEVPAKTVEYFALGVEYSN